MAAFGTWFSLELLAMNQLFIYLPLQFFLDIFFTEKEHGACNSPKQGGKALKVFKDILAH
jgi:hypothetical protein